MMGLPSATQKLSTLTPKHTVIQVEEKAAHVFIIHFASSVGFILRNYLKKKDSVRLGTKPHYKFIKRTGALAVLDQRLEHWTEELRVQIPGQAHVPQL